MDYGLLSVTESQFSSYRISVEVPMVTNGGERQIPWIFQKVNESTTMQMNLINMSMANSVVYRKMKLVGDAQEQESKSKEKPKAALDKKKISEAVKGELSDIGLASRPVEVAIDADNAAGELEEIDPNMEASHPRYRDPKSLSKRDNLSGQKGAVKAKLFQGYHPDEQKVYTSFVTAIDGSGETREKTALDDAVGALQFILDLCAVSKQAAAERPKKRARKDVPSSTPASANEKAEELMLNSFQFCLGIWMEFCFQGEVTAMGKLFRVWSGLRTELQQILKTSHDEFLTPTEDGRTVRAEMDPLVFAKHLCQTFASKPVSEVVMDDAEEANIKRVTTVMALHQSDIVEPLKKFMAEKMHLPLILLDYPLVTMRQLSTTINVGSFRKIVDLMAFLHSNLQNCLPFSWFCFAQDVSDLLTAKGHFVENTEKVFISAENLEKFLSLRVRCTSMILSQAVKNVAELSMPEERPECIEVMSNLESLSEDDPAFIALVTCDVLLSSADWTTTWAAALSEASSVETLADKLLNKLGLDKETIQCQANKLVKGKPMDSAGGAKHESTSAPKTETGDKPEDGDHGDNGSIITLLSTN
ncbi:unnamed protein product, partial [Durusdinium trenchii]